MIGAIILIALVVYVWATTFPPESAEIKAARAAYGKAK